MSLGMLGQQDLELVNGSAQLVGERVQLRAQLPPSTEVDVEPVG